MCIRIKIFDIEEEYGKSMARYFEEQCEGRVQLSVEKIDQNSLDERVLENVKDMINFDRNTNLYLVDSVLYESLRPVLNINKTLVLRRSYETGKLVGVAQTVKYQRPMDLLNEIERLHESNKETDDRRQDVKRTIVYEIKTRLNNDATLASSSDEELRKKIIKMMDMIISDINPEFLRTSEEMRDSLINEIFSSIRGYGILDALLADDTITEIMINGYDNIFVERDGKIERLWESFESQEQLDDIIQKIVGTSGREVNRSSPIVDTRLKDGSRVNVVLPPIALQGSIMTIRKFSKDPMTMDTLLNYGSITPEAFEFLKKLVRARYNIFISGGTGSGKTTFLNALSNFIPKTERIITIEDSAELKIEGIENLVSMETRNSNAAGAGEIPMRSLIKSSLRMRPDRIIVGEVRGIEALDMLQAMNTGHDGSLSTGHANSSEDMLSRLETMILQNSDGIPMAALRRQIASSLDIIVHLSRMFDHTRKVVEISEVRGVDENGNIMLEPLYVFDGTGLSRTENCLQNTLKLKMAGIEI